MYADDTVRETRSGKYERFNPQDICY